MINWQEIRTEFESTTCTMKSLAEKFNVSPSTLRSRKNRENWQREATENVATQNNVVATDKKGAQINNKNSVGNKGNKKASAPKKNKNAVTHGLFAKWLPEETAEIMETIQNRSEVDMLWDSIMFQYTAIIRAQKIMFVDNEHDLSNEVASRSESIEGSATSYAVQYAWDKHASFMNAQSRAMSTLANLIKQFINVADEADERRLKLELMESQIDKLKSDNKTPETSNITIVDAWSDEDE
ncbi:phage terminase small subunit [Vagococcus fluvialis]|uniref:phage terminase small subunit n=1 Tax=Vagococcus fluvialis TaxID=2738 RepID=UPI003B5BACFF